MNFDYKDLRDRIGEEPKWFDENAVPRWEDFHPKVAANIYADEVALVRIRCQNCGHKFKVCISQASHASNKTLENQILQKTISYRDPPNISCCPSGPTMMSEAERVIEYWSRDDFEWKRNPQLEIDVDEDS